MTEDIYGAMNEICEKFDQVNDTLEQIELNTLEISKNR